MTARLFMTTDTVGGVWRYSTNLAALLARGGTSVRLGIIGNPPSADQRAEAAAIAGVDWVHLGVPLDWQAGGADALAPGRRAIAKAAAAWRSDVVQLNQPAYAGDGYAAPTIAVAHSCVETWWRATHGVSAPPTWAWHRDAVGAGLRSADAAVAPSAAFAAALWEAYRLEMPLDVVHNGSPKRADGEKARFVFAAGRLWDDGKNFAVLDEAAPLICWPVRLAGAAAAPGVAELIRYPRVECCGHLDAGKMAEMLAAAPIFVSPSLYEPFGLTVLEAAQAGAALVLADIPSFRELWSDAALFFSPRNAATLAAAANRLIDDPALRATLGLAARERAADYTIECTVEGMGRLYRQVTERRVGAVAVA